MHLCIAGSVRAMPEKEKPPAMPVDIYLIRQIPVLLSKDEYDIIKKIISNSVNFIESVLYI